MLHVGVMGNRQWAVGNGQWAIIWLAKLPTPYSPLPIANSLAVHNLILMIDALHVHSVKVFRDELTGEAEVVAFLICLLQNFVPAVGLKDGDVIVLFEFTDLISNLHTLTEQLQQLIIEMIDLLS